MKKLLFLCFLVFSFSSCEKDDICDPGQPTTPRLILEFYDSNNPAVLKRLTNLRAIGEGQDEAVVFNEDIAVDAPNQQARFLSNENRLALPLNTEADQVIYNLTLNFGSPNPALIFEDQIVINYSRTNTYVSRACGFKTTFQLNPATSPLPPISVTTTNGWINDIEIVQSNIETENEIHVKIYF
jgi:hypothetical protein